jgi:hypothetical protein
VSGYRPIVDVWFLARPKLKDGTKRYGCYLGGFPERARAVLGVLLDDPVLHVCGGMARQYPYANAIGPNDKTLDMDAGVHPDYHQDALDPLPTGFKAMLIDPPYSLEDADHYPVGRRFYPSPGRLVKNAMRSLEPGHRVGIIHYAPPTPPKGARFVFMAAICAGFNNKLRCYSVYEKEWA